ncbi:hypothetical protein GCM10027342_28980 [Photobacterium alginatilyticum]
MAEAKGIDNEEIQDTNDLFDNYLTVKGRVSDLFNENTDLYNRIVVLEEQKDKMIEISNIAETVESLPSAFDESKADDKTNESKEMYNFPSKKVGPWSELRDSISIIVTVPGNVKKGNARVCPEYIGHKYSVISNTHIDGEPIQGSAEVLHANDYIFKANDCSKKIKFDMQISCEDANNIFTSKVITCDKEGKAKWQQGNLQRLDALMTKTQDSSELVILLSE